MLYCVLTIRLFIVLLLLVDWLIYMMDNNVMIRCQLKRSMDDVMVRSIDKTGRRPQTAEISSEQEEIIVHRSGIVHRRNSAFTLTVEVASFPVMFVHF